MVCRSAVPEMFRGKQAEHIIKDMIDSTVQEHTGDNTVILMRIENRPPGKTALVDPGVLPAKNAEKIRFQKDQYIDQDQCCCG